MNGQKTSKSMKRATREDLKKLICANAEKMLNATVKSIEDGRERAFYMYQENSHIESTPVRVGGEYSIRMKRESETLRDMKDLYPEMLLVGFHTHPSPSFMPSEMDKLKSIHMGEDVTCIGSVESPEQRFVDVWCWVVDEETGDIETFDGEVDECLNPRRRR